MYMIIMQEILVPFNRWQQVTLDFKGSSKDHRWSQRKIGLWLKCCQLYPSIFFSWQVGLQSPQNSTQCTDNNSNNFIF